MGQVLLRGRFCAVALPDDCCEFSAGHDERRNRLPRPLKRAFTVNQRLLKVTTAYGSYSERHPCFSVAHRRPLRAVEVGACPEYFAGECLCELVFADQPVAVHGVEIELRWVYD